MWKSWVLVGCILSVMINSSLSLTGCKKNELDALIKFKHSFTEDTQHFLSSWVGDDCCQWVGVTCDNVTSNVIRLDASNNSPSRYESSLESSELSSALLDLKFLRHLNLGSINFNGSRIPEFIGSMTNLRYLYLDGAGFSGLIPPQLGNLTNLIDLRLSSNSSKIGQSMLYTQETLEWASGLSKLQFLTMSLINMSQTYDTLQVLLRLPSLVELTVSACALRNNHSSELLITNTSNTLSSTLQSLELSDNLFEGPFPSFLRKFGSLQLLSLRDNSFSGLVPLWLGNMSNLQRLDLSHNKLNGSLPSVLGQLTNLNYLDMSFNEFQGQVPKSLERLSALQSLSLSNNRLSGLFPHILENMTEIESLEIHSNSFQGTVPGIGNLSDLFYLDLSFTELNLSSSTSWYPPFQLEVFDVQSCEINTVFPPWLRNQTQIIWLDLSNTGISGELPQWIWNISTIQWLEIGDNKLTGSLPQHITCDGCSLQMLYLHNNMLSGSIPYWLSHHESLDAIDLSGNLLSGAIFEGNNASLLLSGRKIRTVLDLSDNMLSGEIKVDNVRPSNSLQILSLRGNDFIGSISSQLCQFPNLRILELAFNHLTGHIPRCFGSVLFDGHYIAYSGHNGLLIHETINGIIEEFDELTGIYSMIDFSSNHLVGTIPEDLTNISKLMELNLSNNHLTGVIPRELGNLQLLESLDLSNNNLSGTIPQSLSAIPWLSFLNLSNNILHGPIPTGNQLQTLDNPSIYAGNFGLCGFPLRNNCVKPDASPSQASMDPNKEDKQEKLWLYLVIMLGVITGFWGVVGTLVLKRSWRHAYFRFVDETADKVYVPIKVMANRFRNRM